MEAADFIKSVQTLIQPLSDKLSDLHAEVREVRAKVEDAADRMPTTEMYRVLQSCARGNPPCRPTKTPAGWLTQVVRHPATPWLVAFTLVCILFIASLSAMTGRDARTLVPVGGPNAPVSSNPGPHSDGRVLPDPNAGKLVHADPANGG